MAYQGAAHAHVVPPFCGAPALYREGGVPMSALQYERCMPPGNWDQGPCFAQARAAPPWGAQPAPAEAQRRPSASGAPPAAAASSILSTSPQKKPKAAARAAPFAGADGGAATAQGGATPSWRPSANGRACGQEEPWPQQGSASVDSTSGAGSASAGSARAAAPAEAPFFQDLPEHRLGGAVRHRERGRHQGRKDMSQQYSFPSTIQVRNTFLDVPERSPSLERFYQERLLQSAPVSMKGSAASGSGSSGRSGPPSCPPSSGPPSSAGSARFGLLDDAARSAPGARKEPRPSGGGGYTSLGMVGADGGDLQQDPTNILLQGCCSKSTSSGEMRGSTVAGSSTISSKSHTDSAPAPADAGDVDPEGPVLGSAEFPSRGSALHQWGVCKPCAFVFQGGCNNGVDCQFCHLCEPGGGRNSMSLAATACLG